MVTELLLLLSLAAGVPPQAAPVQPPPIQGRVVDASGLPLPGAVITSKSAADVLAVTDNDGRFTVKAAPADGWVVVSLPGFDRQDIRVAGSAGQLIKVVLVIAAVQALVTVTGKLEAPLTEPRLALTPLDVVRTPGTQADLMRALATLPGVTSVDDGAGLFVQGGDVSEVLVLLDGVVVNHPYRYETPTGGFRGAVDPFLTQGASFTTGGFSAEYGNSMSAVVDLQGLGRPQGRQVSVTAGLAGLSGSAAAPLGEHGGVRFAANRTTPSLLFAVNPSPLAFDQLPSGWDASGSAHLESSRFGAFRGFTLTQQDHVGVELDQGAFTGFLHSGTQHALQLGRWEKAWGPIWQSSVSFGRDAYTQSVDVGVLQKKQGDTHHSGRAEFTGLLSGWHVRFGTDTDVADTAITGHVPDQGNDLAGVSGVSTFRVDQHTWHASVFGVAGHTFGGVTPEVGWRADRFGHSRTWTLDPRLAVAFKIGRDRQVRLAVGRYSQEPAAGYFDEVRGAATLPPMQATHVVLSYERGLSTGPSLFRIESYYKRYRRLPLEDAGLGFVSTGYGSARGIDLFMKHTWPKLDIRFTGSVLHAERRWTPVDQLFSYPIPASGTWAPDFDIPVSWNIVVNVPVSRAFSVGATWRRASGRPVTPAVGATPTANGFEPTWGGINSDRLPKYERLDLSASLITLAGSKATAVFFVSLDNVFDRLNFFDYAYSADYSSRRPVPSAAPRAFYVGCSITLTR